MDKHNILVQIMLIYTLAFSGAASSTIFEVKSEEELNSLQSSKECLAIIYEVGELPKDFLHTLTKAQTQLKEFNIEIVKINCSETPVESCPEKSEVLLTGALIGNESFATDHLYDQNSVIAHFLTFALSNEVVYVDNEEDWKSNIIHAKGKRDLVLFFGEGLGSKEHRYFMEVAYAFASTHNFAITTSFTPPDAASSVSDAKYSIWYYKCKDVQDPEVPCSSRILDSTLSGVLDIVQFFLDRTFPEVSYVEENGTTAFDEELQVSIPLNIAYMFATGEKIKAVQEMVELISPFLNHRVHFVIVDAIKHPSIVEKFGVIIKKDTPTLALEMRNLPKLGATCIEQWENGTEFAADYVSRFLKKLYKNPLKYFKERAGNFTATAVNSMKELIKIPGSFVGACHFETDCTEFKVINRRLRRTLHHAGHGDIVFNYADQEDVMSFRYIKANEEIVEFDKEFTYLNMLSFVTKELSLEDVKPIPLSGIDLISTDEGIETVENQGYEDEDGGEDYDDEDDETDLQLLNKEEDEVAKDMITEIKNKTAPVRIQKYHHVESLTDKTFPKYLKEFQLLVVHFFLPWDSRSFLFREEYDKMARSLDKTETKNVKIAEVNCNDWPDVCAVANVTAYPMILIYKNGVKEIHYRGILSRIPLLKAIRTYQAPKLTKLASSDEIIQFGAGEIHTPSAEACGVSVVAFLATENSEEFMTFKSASNALFGRALFGYAGDDAAKASAKLFGLQIPTVVVFNRQDPYQPQRISTDFTSDGLTTFIQASLLPSFGELTAHNFPSYQALKKPYLILFKKRNEKTQFLEPVIELARSDMISKVLLTWMDRDLNVTKKLLKTYLGSSEMSAVVLVNHNKGAVYSYASSDSPTIGRWIEDCQLGKIQPKHVLADGKWKPLKEGYDYAKLAETITDFEGHEEPEQGGSPEKHKTRYGRFPPVNPMHSQQHAEHDEL